MPRGATESAGIRDQFALDSSCKILASAPVVIVSQLPQYLNTRHDIGAAFDLHI